MTIKIAIIGAGGKSWTPMLMRDVLGVPELQDTVFAFTDLNLDAVEGAADRCRRDIERNNLPAKIIATTDRRRAVEDADYVFNVTRIGGIEAMFHDFVIPLKYGIDQCVADTLCMGGIMYGQRNIPNILDFCKDIREVAKPGALLLNYANPNCMNTWAANQYGGVRTIGLCHGVMNGHAQIAEVIELLINGKKTPKSPTFKKVTTQDVDIICAGVNHQTWYIQVLYEGEDWTDRLLEGFERHPLYRELEKARIEVLRRFGYYTTESSAHFSEYVPWFRKRPAEIAQWVHPDTMILGETAGGLRYNMGLGTKTFVLPSTQPKDGVIGPSNRSCEHGSYIIESLETGRPFRGHFNVMNNGCISNLPDDCCIETPGYVDGNGINIPRVGPLPLGCAAICNASISVQRLSVEAAVHGDVDLLKQAALMDPLTAAVCDPNEISQLVDQLLVSEAKWLPQYRSEIPKARRRLAKEKPLGTHSISRLKWLKAARQPGLHRTRRKK